MAELTELEKLRWRAEELELEAKEIKAPRVTDAVLQELDAVKKRIAELEAEG